MLKVTENIKQSCIIRVYDIPIGEVFRGFINERSGNSIFLRMFHGVVDFNNPRLVWSESDNLTVTNYTPVDAELIIKNKE